jgi:uncharacterized membrane protein
MQADVFKNGKTDAVILTRNGFLNFVPLFMPEDEPDQETLERWHQDPSNWILGVFYFNPKDKRLLVLKRLKFFGMTLNFAHPFSMVLLGGLVTMAVLVGLNSIRQ